MLDVTRPDPKIFNMAANKVRDGQPHVKAILSSVEELYPETVLSNPSTFVAAFNWKWDHVHQYHDCFGTIGTGHVPVASGAILFARKNLVATSLESMSGLCSFNFAGNK